MSAVEKDPASLACLIYTSGTTGKPKGGREFWKEKKKERKRGGKWKEKGKSTTELTDERFFSSSFRALSLIPFPVLLLPSILVGVELSHRNIMSNVEVPTLIFFPSSFSPVAAPYHTSHLARILSLFFAYKTYNSSYRYSNVRLFFLPLFPQGTSMMLHDHYTHEDVSLSFLPWAHVYGQSVELHGAIHTGAAIACAEGVKRQE